MKQLLVKQTINKEWFPNIVPIDNSLSIQKVKTSTTNIDNSLSIHKVKTSTHYVWVCVLQCRCDKNILYLIKTGNNFEVNRKINLKSTATLI